MYSVSAIDKYILEHSSPEDAVLEELNRETHLKVLNPRMLSGHLQGKVLELISRLCRPQQILEIGTYTGYSAICLAKGLQLGGQLHTIDYNDEIAHIASKYFDKSGLANCIQCYTGDAIDIIPSINMQFDLVFIDADKESYCEFYNLVIDKVVPGGIILADNVLWSGKVLEDIARMDNETRAIDKFNQMVLNDSRVEVFILPVRDGISVIRKL